MLGTEIFDEGFESRCGRYEGIGLFKGTTRFSRYEKVTKQVYREALLVGPILSRMGSVRGYEIHMGETARAGDNEAFSGEGAVSEDGLVIGTYLHGLFENPSAVEALLTYLYEKKGLDFTIDATERDRDVYEDLAALFERHVKVEPILALFGD